MKIYARTPLLLAVLLGLWMLAPLIGAQDETDSSPFGDGMRLLADELDTSAENTLSAMSD